MNRGKNSAHVGNDTTSETVTTPGRASGLPLAVTALAARQRSQAREGTAQETLLVRPHVCWHRLLLWAEPRGTPACHWAQQEEQDPYLLQQALAHAQTKEIQLQGCLGQTQTQSMSDSIEQASPLCLWKQMKKFMCMILKKQLIHSMAPETCCSRISWLSPWSPCVYLLLTGACLGTVFPVWPKTLALAKHQSPTVLEE